MSGSDDQKELIYKTEQRMLPRSKRDCVVCRGNGFYIDPKTRMSCECTRCAGTGREEAAAFHKAASFGATYGMGPNELLKAYGDSLTRADREKLREALAHHETKCSACLGTGVVTASKPPAAGGGFTTLGCPACGGTGNLENVISNVRGMKSSKQLHPSARNGKPTLTHDERKERIFGQKSVKQVLDNYARIRAAKKVRGG